MESPHLSGKPGGDWLAQESREDFDLHAKKKSCKFINSNEMLLEKAGTCDIFHLLHELRLYNFIVIVSIYLSI